MSDQRSSFDDMVTARMADHGLRSSTEAGEFCSGDYYRAFSADHVKDGNLAHVIIRASASELAENSDRVRLANLAEARAAVASRAYQNNVIGYRKD